MGGIKMDGKIYHLIDKNGNPYDSTTPGTLGGYKKLKIYGKLDCPSALNYISKGQYVKYRVFLQMKKQQLQQDIDHVQNV